MKVEQKKEQKVKRGQDSRRHCWKRKRCKKERDRFERGWKKKNFSLLRAGGQKKG